MPLLLFCLLLCGLFPPGSALAESSVIERVQKQENSIVEVRTELTKVMHTTSETSSSAPVRMATFERIGAGLVIDPSGIIVTNTHTIINAPFIFVILRDGTKLEAKVLFASQEYDFSFLKIDPPHALRPIEWADSSQMSLGEDVIAIGNSDFDNQSILAGHVKSIIQSRTQGTYDFLELDMALYHGDSGGPVLDTQGRLLGMIMAKRESQQNSSIAIAANKIHEQYWQYKRNMP